MKGRNAIGTPGSAAGHDSPSYRRTRASRTPTVFSIGGGEVEDLPMAEPLASTMNLAEGMQATANGAVVAAAVVADNDDNDDVDAEGEVDDA